MLFINVKLIVGGLIASIEIPKTGQEPRSHAIITFFVQWALKKSQQKNLTTIKTPTQRQFSDILACVLTMLQIKNLKSLPSSMASEKQFS